MAQKTCRKLVGAIKYVLIDIDNFSFLIDLVILDYKADPKIPLILGKSFMKNVRMLVVFDKGEGKVKIKYCEISYKVIGAT